MAQQGFVFLARVEISDISVPPAEAGKARTGLTRPARPYVSD
jgi:hypothetical protein